MKLLDYSGLQRFLNKIKTLLDSKSNTGHTHVTSEVTDLLNSQHTWSVQQSYSADLNLNYSSTDVDDILDTVAGSYTAEDFLAQNNVWTGRNQFTNDINRKSTSYEIGNTPASNVSLPIRFTDKNNNSVGWVRSYVNTSGETGTEIVTTNKFKNNALDPTGTQTYQSLNVGIDNTGSGYHQFSGKLKQSELPFTTDTYDLGSSSYQWKSVYAQSYYCNGTAWGLDKANEWTGENTFKATITYEGNLAFYWKRPNLTVGTLPSSSMYYGSTRYGDSAGTTITLTRGLVDTSGKNYFRQYTYAFNDTSKYCYMGSGINADGSGSYFAFGAESVIPVDNNTTDLGSSTNQWRKIYSADVVHTSGDETITGIKTLIDYWHLQAKNLKAGEGETYGRTGYSLVYTDKNDVTMGDVTLFKNSGAARTFIRIRGGDYYTNGAPAAAGTLVQSALMVGTNVSGKKIIECDSDIVYPTTTNATDLGDSTHQWANIYAKKTYTDTVKADTGILSLQSKGTNNSIAIFNGDAAADGGGFWAYGKDHPNGSDCRIQIYNTSKSRYERVDLVDSQFLPTPSGEIDLGSSTNRWKSVHGVTIYENGTALSSKYQALSEATSVEVGLGQTFLVGIRADRVKAANVSTGTRLEYQVSTIKASALTVLEFIVGSGTSGLNLVVSETSSVPSSGGTYVWLGKSYNSIVSSANQYYVGIVKRISIR